MRVRLESRLEVVRYGEMYIGADAVLRKVLNCCLAVACNGDSEVRNVMGAVGRQDLEGAALGGSHIPGNNVAAALIVGVQHGKPSQKEGRLDLIEAGIHSAGERDLILSGPAVLP